MFTVIAAITLENRIVFQNTIPWSIKEDKRQFCQKTNGGIIIMGRNTWFSLPKRPLPNRINIVLSSQPIEDCHYTASSFQDALQYAYKINIEQGQSKKIFIIGGSKLYHCALLHPQ